MWAIDKLQEFTVPEPVAGKTTNDELNKLILTRGADAYVSREGYYRESNSTTFSVLWGQCSNTLKDELEARPEYEQIRGCEVITLLKIIRELCFNLKQKVHPYVSTYQAMMRLYTTFQRYWVTSTQYMETFASNAAVVDQSGRNFSEHANLVLYELRKMGVAEGSEPSEEALLHATNVSKEAYAATFFLCSLNKEKYKPLLHDLANKFLQGDDRYHKTVHDALSYVQNWKGVLGNITAWTNDGVNFFTVVEEDSAYEEE